MGCVDIEKFHQSELHPRDKQNEDDALVLLGSGDRYMPIVMEQGDSIYVAEVMRLLHGGIEDMFADPEIPPSDAASYANMALPVMAVSGNYVERVAFNDTSENGDGLSFDVDVSLATDVHGTRSADAVPALCYGVLSPGENIRVDETLLMDRDDLEDAYPYTFDRDPIQHRLFWPVGAGSDSVEPVPVELERRGTEQGSWGEFMYWADTEDPFETHVRDIAPVIHLGDENYLNLDLPESDIADETFRRRTGIDSARTDRMEPGMIGHVRIPDFPGVLLQQAEEAVDLYLRASHEHADFLPVDQYQSKIQQRYARDGKYLAEFTEAFMLKDGDAYPVPRSVFDSLVAGPAGDLYTEIVDDAGRGGSIGFQ